MSNDQKTAQADQKPASSGPITGGRIVRIRDEKTSRPALRFKGSEPRKGSRIEFKTASGAICTGIVADATESDGEVLVEFKDGFTPK